MKSRASLNVLRMVQSFFPNVKEVNDATKDEVIKVTDSDVERSTKKDHNNCALAEATESIFTAVQA